MALLAKFSYISGASSGLSLTLNIEEYNYMPGPQTDSGVKVTYWQLQHL